MTWPVFCTAFLLFAALIFLHFPSTLSLGKKSFVDWNLSAMDVSCPTNEFDTGKRAVFSRKGVKIFGWPSTGGTLIKESANIVDLTFLGADRLHPSRRAATNAEEDHFCDKLRKVGAKWWEDEQSYLDVAIGAREPTESEERELILAWPSNGGVWILTYPTESAIPKDFGRINMALDMDERSSVMKEYGATYFDHPDQAAHFWTQSEESH